MPENDALSSIVQIPLRNSRVVADTSGMDAGVKEQFVRSLRQQGKTVITPEEIKTLSLDDKADIMEAVGKQSSTLGNINKGANNPTFLRYQNILDRTFESTQLPDSFHQVQQPRHEEFAQWLSDNKTQEFTRDWGSKTETQRLEFLQDVADAHSRIYESDPMAIAPGKLPAGTHLATLRATGYGNARAHAMALGSTVREVVGDGVDLLDPRVDTTNVPIINVNNASGELLHTDGAKTLEGVIHEASHVQQGTLGRQYRLGKITPSDPVYEAARVFSANDPTHGAYIDAYTNFSSYQSNPIEVDAVNRASTIVEMARSKEASYHPTWISPDSPAINTDAMASSIINAKPGDEQRLIINNIRNDCKTVPGYAEKINAALPEVTDKLRAAGYDDVRIGKLTKAVTYVTKEDLAARTAATAVEVKTPVAPHATTLPVSEVPSASAAEAGSSLGKFMAGAGKVVGPAALVAPTAIEGFQGGYQAYKDGKGTGEIAGSTAVGMGKGAVDTVAPGARDGYSDVIGKKDITWADRALNATDHASATTAAVGGIAMAGEAAGVVTIPAVIPTALATGAAGITNVGVNVAKAGLKATGLSGKDQDGGYIYNALSQEERLKTHYSTDELQSQLKSGKGPLYDSFAKQYGEEFDTRQNSPDHGGMTALPKGLSRDQFIKNRIDFAAHDHAGTFGGSATDVERIAPTAPAPEINHSMASVADTHPMAALVDKDKHVAAKKLVNSTQNDAAPPSAPAVIPVVAQSPSKDSVQAARS